MQNEEKLAYKTNSWGLRNCKDILKALATLDHKNTEISAYL